MNFGFVVRLVISMFLPPVPVRSGAFHVQSSVGGSVAQIPGFYDMLGKWVSLIIQVCRCRKRYLASRGKCPVRICVKILVVFRERFEISFMNRRSEGVQVVGSVFFILLYYCFALVHAFCARRFSFSLYAHFIADFIFGSRGLCSSLGSRSGVELPLA